MLPRDIRTHLDRARASSDPASDLEEVVRSLKSKGLAQYHLYRLLLKYQAGLDWDELDAADGLIDLAWGAPWAVVRPLFDRPLVEVASLLAGNRLDSVNDVVTNLKKWDGRPTRIWGELWLRFEISALWHAPATERRSGDESSLALGDDLRRWLRLREYEGHPVPGAPPSWDAKGVSLWLHEEFSDRLVEVTAFVDAPNRGHLGCRPGGIFILKIVGANATTD
jgi:hypothetical protein